MPKKTPKQARQTIAEAEARRRALGLSQTQWAMRLGVTQGHYSKIVSGKASPGRGLLDRAKRIGELEASDGFEKDLLSACRSAPRFRQVLSLLLDMHGHAFSRPTKGPPAG